RCSGVSSRRRSRPGAGPGFSAAWSFGSPLTFSLMARTSVSLLLIREIVHDHLFGVLLMALVALCVLRAFQIFLQTARVIEVDKQAELIVLACEFGGILFGARTTTDPAHRRDLAEHVMGVLDRRLHFSRRGIAFHVQDDGMDEPGPVGLGVLVCGARRV